jgi:hypothetical protein
LKNNICRGVCNKRGCELPYERKLDIFHQYYGTKDSDHQSFILGMHLELHEVADRTTDEPNASRRKRTTRYFLRNENGIRLECCVETFKNVFAVTPGRIRTILEKLAGGKIDLSDQRGKHSFNRFAIDPEIRDEMLQHIQRLPRTLSHYSRRVRLITHYKILFVCMNII